VNKLLIFILFISTLSFSQEEKRLALVIGNSNYDSIAVLKNPVNDAKLIAKTLDSLSFDVILATDLDKGEFMSKVLEFGKRRSDYDVGFVYYAGHGVQINGENYLLPTNQNFDEEWKIEEYAINVNRIMKYLTALTDQVNILILDACRNNPWEGSFRSVGGSNNGGLAKIPAPTGSLIAFSTDAGTVASDGDGDNSIYCKSLVDNMLKKGTSIDQVFRNVRSDVLKASNEQQRPIESSQLTGQAFYLLKRDFDKEILLSESMIDEGKNEEAIYLLESIHESDLQNLEIVSMLSKAYVSNASSYITSYLEPYPKMAIQNFENARILLSKYILSTINDTILNTEVQSSQEIAQLYYRKSRYHYYSKMDVNWTQVFLNLDMAIKYDNQNPYFDYYYGTIYYEQYDQGEEADNINKSKVYYSRAIEKYLDKISQISNPHSDSTISSSWDPELYFYLGFSYYNYSELDLVKTEMEEAKELAFKYWNKVLIKADFKRKKWYINFISKKNYYYQISLNNNKNALESFNKIIELDTESSESYYYRGQFYADYLEDYEKAIADFSKALELDPDNAKLYFERGLSYAYSDNNIKSIADWIICLEIDPQFDVALYNNIAVQYVNLNEYNKALEIYERAIKMDSTYSHAYRNRAELYSINFNDNENALLDYNKMVEFDPENSDSYYYRGEFYADYLEDFEKAIEDYSKGIELNPNDPDLYFQRALLNHNEFNDYDQSIIDYLKVIDFNPKLAAVYNNLAQIYNYELRDFDKALEFYTKTIENDSTASYAYKNRANLYSNSLNDNESALLDYNKIIELDPENSDSYYYRGEFYADYLEDYKKAIEDYSKGIELNPDNAKFYFSRGLSYGNLDNTIKSIADYLKCLEIDPEYDVALYNNLAVSYENLKDFDKALEVYVMAIKIDSTYVYAYRNKADLYSDNLNDNKNALLNYNKTVELEPEDSDNYYYRGVFYADYIEDYEKAIEDYSKGIELNPNDVDLYVGRAEAYELNNNFNESIIDYLKIREIDTSYVPYVNYKIGDIYYATNKLLKAEEYLSNAIELNYWNLAPVHQTLGYVYLKNKDNEKAIEEFNKTLELEPENSNYLLGKLNYFVLTKNFDAAIKLCYNLIERDNKDPHAFYILADIYNNKSFVNNSQTKSLINISLAIDKLTYLGEYNYFITDYYNLERIELVDLYKFRAKIFENLNENSFSCSDYNKVLELIDNDSADANSVVLLISKNCSD